MTNLNDKLVKTKIKGRTETYFLVSENDLNNIRSNKVTGEIFLFIATGLIGFYAAKPENLYLLILGIICFGVFIFFSYFKKPTIKEIIGSGDTKSVLKESYDDTRLKILEAKYGSPAKNFNVTDELNKQIRDDKLKTVASNEITGDPDKGVVKTLSIKYSHNGLIITKEFKENEPVELP
ncbi:hypothetical protein KKF32_00160 [Patescibacteria group bacterium]|nr:hypothetical protein [Patescibacteria group bacterium]